jgi:hypothetical protein
VEILLVKEMLLPDAYAADVQVANCFALVHCVRLGHFGPCAC